MTTTNTSIVSLTEMDIENKINLTDASDKMRVESYLNQVLDCRKIMATKLIELKVLMPLVIEALAKQNILIKEFLCGKGGSSDPWLWSGLETNYLNISINGCSNGKFKFYAFRGYTSKGSDKNESRIREKHAQIVSAIKAHTGLSNFYLNSSCLSLRRNNNPAEVQNILMSFSI